MTYLAVSFAAPALGVFPYLLVASGTPSSSFWSQALFFTVLFIGNVGIALMIVVMAYSGPLSLAWPVGGDHSDFYHHGYARDATDSGLAP
jgi:hypothetical protein